MPRLTRLTVVFIVGVVATANVLIAVASPALANSEDLVRRAEQVIKCVQLDGETYCTDVGFIGVRPHSGAMRDYLEGMMLADLGGEGDMSFADLVSYLHSLPREELALHQKEQIAQARGGVGRLKLVKHLAEARPVPDGFFEMYPQLDIKEDSDVARALRAAAADPTDKLLVEHLAEHGALPLGPTQLDPLGENGLASWAITLQDTQNTDAAIERAATLSSAPSYRYIIYYAYREQIRCDFCGPATFQSIDGADDGGYNSQYYWDDYVGSYDAQGRYSAALSRIKDAINSYTAWDNSGGAYDLISLVGQDQAFYKAQHEVRIGLYGAPVVEHVYLDTEYFPYLDRHWWSSGHFQTGRGYSSTSVAILEPYDERDCITGGAFTATRQYVSWTNMYNASQAHPHKNMAG